MTKLLVLGEESDVRAFALAGAEGRVVKGAAELTKELAAPGAAGLLLVSASLAHAAPAAIAAARDRRDGPLVLVLPDRGSP
jgi:vacuolar-type H+-ATPase subunit F/Vma7